VFDYSQRLNVEFTRLGHQVHAMQKPVALTRVPSILDELREARPDILLMQYPNAAYRHSLTPHLLANIAGRTPFVLTLHEFEPAHPLRKLSIALFARARAIVVTNDADRIQLTRWYPWLSGRVRVVPLASNIAGRPWRPDPVFTVVHFGLFRPGKGLEQFLECVRLVKAHTSRIRFRAVGAMTGADAGYGKAFLDEARVLDVQVLVGASEEQVAVALSSASIAYLPFPDGATARRGSVLAAASCGVPLLSTTGPFTAPELAAALLVVSSPASAAEQLLALLDDPHRLEAAHERSRRFGETFTWEGAAERYMDVFETVSARPAPCRQ
jgi:glycosyltransferase involved in cell wall biosynthesis